MRTFVCGAEEAVTTELAAILPPVTAAMHDTKNEVRRTPIIRSNFRRISFPKGYFCSCQVYDCIVYDSS